MNRLTALFYTCFPRALAVAVVSLLMFAINPAQEHAMAANAASVIGWIEIVPVPGRNDHITIRGHIQALKAVEGKFVLRVIRASGGNKSDNKQGGRFSAQAGETRALSSTTINLQPDDHLEITLTLSIGGADVFTTILRSS